MRHRVLRANKQTNAPMLIRLSEGERILLEGAAGGELRPADQKTYSTDLEALLKLRLVREEEGQIGITILGKLLLKWTREA